MYVHIYKAYSSMRETWAGEYQKTDAFPIYASFSTTNPQVCLYTILPSPIVYGVWHTRGWSEGSRILLNSRAIVVQACGQCGWGGGNKRGLIRAHKPRSKAISCKRQPAGARSLDGHLRPLYGAPCIYIYIYIYIWVCVCIYVCMYVCMYVYTYIQG